MKPPIAEQKFMCHLYTNKIQNVIYRILHHKPVLLEKQINRAENFLSPLNRRAGRCRRKANADKFERRKNKEA
jgi:hypothetical protein